MENQKCHCNGSNGTDCYYCQGTGFVSKPFHIEGVPLQKVGLAAAHLKLINSNRQKPLSDRISFLELEMKQPHKDVKLIKQLGSYLITTWKELLLAKQPTTTATKKTYKELLNRTDTLKIVYRKKFKRKPI